jgi:hypothetical protein
MALQDDTNTLLGIGSPCNVRLSVDNKSSRAIPNVCVQVRQEIKYTAGSRHKFETIIVGFVPVPIFPLAPNTSGEQTVSISHLFTEVCEHVPGSVVESLTMISAVVEIPWALNPDCKLQVLYLHDRPATGFDNDMMMNETAAFLQNTYSQGPPQPAMIYTQQQPPMYGQQQPMYGQQQPMYGQPTYGQPTYGQQQPMSMQPHQFVTGQPHGQQTSAPQGSGDPDFDDLITKIQSSSSNAKAVIEDWVMKHPSSRPSPQQLAAAISKVFSLLQAEAVATLAPNIQGVTCAHVVAVLEVVSFSDKVGVLKAFAPFIQDRHNKEMILSSASMLDRGDYEKALA